MQLRTADALGGVTVICASKAGALTSDAMMVTDVRTATRAYGVTGHGWAPTGSFVLERRTVAPGGEPDLLFALRTAALANRSDAVSTGRGWRVVGDPLEAALVVAARKAGIERDDIVSRAPEIGAVPFNAGRGMMATFHRQPLDGLVLACVKGSPDRVLPLCRRVRVDGVEVPLDQAILAGMLGANHLMAIRGLTVIAVASGIVPRADEAALEALTLDGLIGVTDPPAAGAPEAIEVFRQAGVRTVLLTADQKETAVAAAGELGIDYSPLKVLEGREVDALGDEALRDRLADVNVFSRVGPEAKRRIVAGFKARGEVVAVVGDTVGDAAALQVADVHLAAGRTGPRPLEILIQAVRDGRVYVDNIQKFVFYLFSCGLAGTLLLAGAAAAGWPFELLAIQALWLSLVTAVFPALSLAIEPPQPDVMQRPPRDLRSALLSRSFVRAIIFYGLLMAAATLLVVAWSWSAGVDAGHAVTMNFMTLALAQLLHLGNARDSRPVVTPRRALANRFALMAVGVVLALQMLAVTTEPLRWLLHLEPLTRTEWLVVIVAGLIPAVAGQVFKALPQD
ncbi:MAG TPA: cation transporting ATPase C-terminal domain-containing protein [Vicinamibacterales bacterium]|nr:cation transporting ATPase C-terminal domain-containing protein [Vicinamibacterales bacterium]